MSRVNTVHGLYDHDLRGHVRASSLFAKGIILGVFSHGKFNRESSVIPVKLSVRKDSLIKRVKKTFTARQHVREIVKQAFVSGPVKQMPIRFFEAYIQKKYTRGGWS
jgi:hypothetical protein